MSALAERAAGAIDERARAKVNLTLHVTGRRADGYHLLDSLVVFAAVADRVRAERGAGLSLALSGPFGTALAQAGGDGEDNLVLRAARLLAGRAGRSCEARITLEKNLPVASGIGGGSSDAAATLRALARLWDVAMPPGDAVLALGADLPVCVADRPALMRGIGEILLPAPRLPAFWLLLVNPGIAVSTGAVFAGARASGLRAAPELPEGWADAAAMADTLAQSRNDLEAPAIAMVPAIGTVLAALGGQEGCLLARMSGSGATCFGVFADATRAAAAAAALDGRGWWVACGAVGDAQDGCATEAKRTVS